MASNLEDYLNENYVVKDSTYKSTKDQIFCYICHEILIKPVMCMTCQKVFCKKCIEKWINIKNFCPNKCTYYPEYKNSIIVGNILSKLNFNCKDCGQIINYEKMEKHILSICDTIEIKYDLLNKKSSPDEGIFKKVLEKKKNREGMEQTNIKIICLGSSGVGKSSLIQSFINNKISAEQLSTVGIENIYGDFILPDGSKVNCLFYDTNGNKRYRPTNESFYKKVDACILVFDVTNQESFDEIKNYFVPQIKERCMENIPVLIIGNKIDLIDLRVVSKQEAAEFTYSNNNFLYKETSCFENIYFFEMFEDIIEMAKDNIDNNPRYKINDSNEGNNSFVIMGLNANRRRCLTCC